MSSTSPTTNVLYNKIFVVLDTRITTCLKIPHIRKCMQVNRRKFIQVAKVTKTVFGTGIQLQFLKRFFFFETACGPPVVRTPQFDKRWRKVYKLLYRIGLVRFKWFYTYANFNDSACCFQKLCYAYPPLQSNAYHVPPIFFIARPPSQRKLGMI
jgi:hypothetical protein